MRITGGRLRNRNLQVPHGLAVRPSSGRLRESLFNICQHRIEGEHVLDLFAGSGAVGIEALSRGAASCTFVEMDKQSLKALQHNLTSLDLLKESAVVPHDVLKGLDLLQRQEKRFDIIFLDPPYHSDGKVENSWSWKVLMQLDCGRLLSEEGWIFVEDSAEASVAEPPLEHLKAWRSRRMGRSHLRHYAMYE
ncbi:MAG: 16S rRNA (guanine(966)-N(2))-methyltransferase RsmD [Chlamydiia bacterium]|nr:16S rRNA (guanine(966)-N(2))-methyltransferase RsmD [Chlamydiia bacterium]